MQASDIGVQWPGWRSRGRSLPGQGPDRDNAALATPQRAPKGLCFSYASLKVDDRATFYLNNRQIGTFVLSNPTSLSGSISNSAYFSPGATNTFSLIVVNNPWNPSGGNPIPFQTNTDYTTVALRASISYDLPSTPVPEPATILLLGLGLPAVAFTRKKFRK